MKGRNKKIKKIIKIQDLGKFINYSSSSDDVSFSDDNIIFGYNTYGKSTLTSIFRSLKEGNKRYLFGRRTFGATGDPQIELLFDNHDTLCFKDTEWKFNNIEIFDNDFIHNNIFYGDEINNKQQANLYNIFINNKVRSLKKKIGIKREEQKEDERQQKRIRDSYSPNKGIDFQKFFDLKDVPNLQLMIKKKEEEIEQLGNIVGIKKMSRESFIRKDFSNFKSMFSKTFDSSMEEKIEEHITQNWENTSASKEFLNTGSILMKENGNCVFCGQALITDESKSLLMRFKKVFSTEYNEFKKEIEESGKKFLRLDIEKELLQYKNLGITLDEKFDIDNFMNAKTQLDYMVEKKQKNLNFLLELESDSNWQTFESEIFKLKQYLTAVEKDLETSKGIDLIKKEFELLKQTEVRFSDTWKPVCKKYLQLQEKISILKKEIPNLNLELENKIAQVFMENEKNINFYLKKLGANFKLAEFKPLQNMQRVNSHFCKYHFMFNDSCKVNISNKENQDQKEPLDLPCFKNTLSDSDRRLLAYSFFLSKLKNDKDLGSKIVVLDDPFSSLDDNRRESTILLLKSVKNTNDEEPLQKIVLTHNEKFYTMCFKKLRSRNRKFQSLSIENSVEKGSYLQQCDVEKKFLKEIFIKDLEYIKNTTTSNQNIKEALTKVRPCLEHLLKEKYFFCLDKNDLKQKSIGSYLKKIKSKCPVKDEILEAHWHEEMHDKHQIMCLSEPEQIKKLLRVLEIFEKI